MEYRTPAVSALSFRLLEQISVASEFGVLLRENETVAMLLNKFESLHGLGINCFREVEKEVACPAMTGNAASQLV